MPLHWKTVFGYFLLALAVISFAFLLLPRTRSRITGWQMFLTAVIGTIIGILFNEHPYVLPGNPLPPMFPFNPNEAPNSVIAKTLGNGIGLANFIAGFGIPFIVLAMYGAIKKQPS